MFVASSSDISVTFKHIQSKDWQRKNSSSINCCPVNNVSSRYCTSYERKQISRPQSPFLLFPINLLPFFSAINSAFSECSNINPHPRPPSSLSESSIFSILAERNSFSRKAEPHILVTRLAYILITQSGGLRYMLTWRQGRSMKATGQSNVYPCHHNPLSLDECDWPAQGSTPEQHGFWQLLTHIIKGQWFHDCSSLFGGRCFFSMQCHPSDDPMDPLFLD